MSQPIRTTRDVTTWSARFVNRPGWTSGSAPTLQFSGTGRRTGESYEGSTTGAPLLHVEWTAGG